MPRENRSTRTVLTVFIGSPGDLQPEREETRKVINGLNSHLARNLGVFIELRGWEDTLPGYARPQEKINEDVRESDLFIGLVWCRWGTSTGEYSSGFEEEYAVAREQRSKAELEDIWLFFKEVPEEMLRDPGDQLRKVQQFKERVTSEREVLYDNFKSKEGWSVKLYNYLSDYLTKDLRSQELAQSGTAPTTDVDSSREPEENDVQQSLAAVMSAVVEDDFEQASLLQAARAYSVSSALFYLKRPDKQLTGTHENQLMYQYRNQLHSTKAEQIHYLRDLAADRDGLKVGWFWLEQMSESIPDILLTMSSFDEFETVKAGALQLVEHIGPDSELGRIEERIDDENAKVATAALQVYSRHAPDALGKLQELAHHQTAEVAGIAWTEALRILVHRDAQQAVAWVLDATLPHKPSYVDILGPLWTDNNPTILRALMEADDLLVRRKAFEKCKASLGDDAVRKASTESDVQLRAAAFMELISRDIEVSEQELEENLKEAERSDFHTESRGDGTTPLHGLEDVLLQLYKTRSYSDLEETIEWASLRGPERYEALVDRYFEEFKVTLRKDLGQNFVRLRERFYTSLVERYGEHVESEIKDWRRLEGFISERFRASALRALSRHAEPDDVELARNFLRKELRAYYDTEAATAALEIVHQHGKPEDVELIKRLVTNSDPTVRSTAARALLQIDTKSISETVEHLLNTKDAELVRVSLEWLLSTEDIVSTDKIRELLYKDTDRIRLYALSYIVCTSSRDELELLLTEYSSRGRHYYYNVTCWLDRILYAPQGLREEYISRTKRRIRESSDLFD